MHNHKDLAAWKQAIEIAEEIYLVTKEFPRQEMFGLVGQMRRSAVSIASNIAEGAARQSKPEFLRFLYISTGSASELDTQLEISARVGLLEHSKASMLQSRVDRLSKIMFGLIRALKKC